MATFFGDQGTELFYLQKEGSKGLTLFRIRDEAHDDSLFSEFISGEIDDLAAWYATTPIERARAEKVARLQAINTRFDATVRPRLRTRQYDGFASRPLNNASLLSLKTYVYDQSDFLRAYELLGRDFKKLLEFCKSLERSKDPQADLKAFARR
jgi:predicted aminopeptidase